MSFCFVVTFFFFSRIPFSNLPVKSEVRECLKLDQDHKQCFSLYKQVKKLNKQIESAEELIREGR